MALHSDENVTEYIKQQLFSMQDLEYKAFHSRLMPTISPETIIGARTPALRKFAKEMAKYEGVETFMQDLPHEFYEENNLQGFIIEGMKDFDKCLAEVDRFLPYVDNWATCDMMSPKALKKNNYDGELTFEIFKYLKNLPKEMLPDALCFAEKVGRHLIAAFDRA